MKVDGQGVDAEEHRPPKEQVWNEERKEPLDNELVFEEPRDGRKLEVKASEAQEQSVGRRSDDRHVNKKVKKHLLQDIKRIDCWPEEDSLIAIKVVSKKAKDSETEALVKGHQHPSSIQPAYASNQGFGYLGDDATGKGSGTDGEEDPSTLLGRFDNLETALHGRQKIVGDDQGRSGSLNDQQRRPHGFDRIEAGPYCFAPRKAFHVGWSLEGAGVLKVILLAKGGGY